MQFVHQPATAARLGDFLKANLEGPWTCFRATVAFVKRSGTRHIVAALTAFARSKQVEIIAGIDHRGTSQEGLQDLLDAVGTAGRVIVFHNRLAFTFHPKVYLFKSDAAAEILVGSGNLTEGGLFTNYEASLRVQLDLTEPAQRAILKSVEDALDGWADPSKGTALSLDSRLLAKLVTHHKSGLEVTAT
jgi:HKD family nuclease